MNKKTIASIIMVIAFAYHEITQLMGGGHASTPFSFFDFSDRVECINNKEQSHDHEPRE